MAAPLLSDVIARKVALKRRPSGEYVGRCPFHRDAASSFTVDDRTGRFHCYGCNAQGDAETFMAKVAGLAA